DRHLLDMRVDEDDVLACTPDRSSSSASAEKVATRSTRARRRNDHRLSGPIERQRNEVWRTGATRSCNPDIDLAPQVLERVLDPYLPRPRHPHRSSHAARAPSEHSTASCRVCGNVG